MTTHFQPEEFTAVLDGTLPAERVLHLEECAECRAAVSDATAMLNLTREEQEIPEPSPLFWDHFSARVQAATTAAPMRRATWWQPVWGPFAAFGVVAALLAIVAIGRLQAPAGLSRPEGPASSASVLGEADDASWRSVAAMTSGLSSDDAQRVMAPASTTMPLVDDLSPQERQMFVQLVKAELSDLR